MTVSDQKGLISRGKRQTSGLHSRAAVVCFQGVSPLRTWDAFTSNVTRLPLFLTSASVAAGLEESRVRVCGGIGGIESVGSWQWPYRGLSDTASASLLHECVPARQHAAICWIPHHHNHRHHHTPDPPFTHPPPSGCCYNHWQRNKLIRRFTALITHAQKCCWRFLFGAQLCARFPLN